jgi:uncharacterized protein (DUF1800 family)
MSLSSLAAARSRAFVPPIASEARSASGRTSLGSTLVTAALLVAACGGGGDASASTPNAEAQSLAPLDRPLADDEIRHLLRRTTFGASQAEVDRVRQLGLDAWLEEQFVMAVDTPVERAAEALIENRVEPRQDEIAKWWLFLMSRNPNGFQEGLAFFWHDHFATSQRVFEDRARAWFLQHVNLLRRMGTGNVKELAYALAIDPSMLVWLDGVSSTRDRPNENFAREFWEVFTLGRNRGYTEGDIKEAARAFTGYRQVVDRTTNETFFLFDASRHDEGQKAVFGQTGNWGYRDIVELTFAHRQAAEYLCERLFAHYCHKDPAPAAIAGMAKLLRDSGWEIKPVLRALFRSRAFYSTASRQGRVKTPIEYVVGFFRTTGMELPINTHYESMLVLNQTPTLPPSVFGWPEDTAWLGAQSLLQRGDVINDALSARSHHTAIGTSLTQLLPPADQRTAATVVDALARLMQVDLKVDERQRLIDFLGTSVREANGQLVVEPSAFDGNSTRHVDERVRALLFVLAQHPQYHLR